MSVICQSEGSNQKKEKTKKGCFVQGLTWLKRTQNTSILYFKKANQLEFKTSNAKGPVNIDQSIENQGLRRT